MTPPKRSRIRPPRAIAALLCVAAAFGSATAASPGAAPAEPAYVVAARSLGVWVVPLLARSRRMLGLAPAARGVLVDGVLALGPAWQAGLQKGDVIGAIDGVPVQSLCELGEKLRAVRPATEVTFAVRRLSGLVPVPVRTIADGRDVAR
ncbi:MAG: PDZ domain-containing protein, partial [Candidatus Binatia bacterium]